jgi:hypothetical protein
MTQFYKNFYVNKNGSRKKFAIFAPGLDRFILIDNYDRLILLQIAEILSSKIPTMVYVLPEDTGNLNDSNCMSYTIFDKTQQKVLSSPIMAARQQPITKFLSNEAKIVEVGIPKDYVNNIEILDRLAEYVYFVKKNMYAINQTEDFCNAFDTSKFANQYLDSTWIDQVSIKSDFSNLKNGVFFELKQILYFSNSVEEAELNIINLWKCNSEDQDHLMRGYYKMLGVKVPEILPTKVDDNKAYYPTNPKNLSQFLF